MWLSYYKKILFCLLYSCFLIVFANFWRPRCVILAPWTLHMSLNFLIPGFWYCFGIMFLWVKVNAAEVTCIIYDNFPFASFWCVIWVWCGNFHQTISPANVWTACNLSWGKVSVDMSHFKLTAQRKNLKEFRRYVEDEMRAIQNYYLVWFVISYISISILCIIWNVISHIHWDFYVKYTFLPCLSLCINLLFYWSRPKVWKLLVYCVIARKETTFPMLSIWLLQYQKLWGSDLTVLKVSGCFLVWRLWFLFSRSQILSNYLMLGLKNNGALALCSYKFLNSLKPYWPSLLALSESGWQNWVLFSVFLI